MNNYPAPKKEHFLRNAFLVGLGAVVLLIILIGGIAAVTGKSSQPQGQPPAPLVLASPTSSTLPMTPSRYVPSSVTPSISYAPPAGDRWTFIVETTGPGLNSVTYMKPGFNIAQDTAPKGKRWVKEIQADYGFGQPNMNAQNKDKGSITCRIQKNGETVVENTSDGAYAVVMCM